MFATILSTGADPCCVVLAVVGIPVLVYWFVQDHQKLKAKQAQKERLEKIAAEEAEAERLARQPVTADTAREAVQNVKHALDRICETTRQAAVRAHPLVRFRHANVERLAGVVELAEELKSCPQSKLLEVQTRLFFKAHDIYRRELSQDFQTHPCDLVIREIAHGSHGPDDFWEYEERHRGSTAGTNAADWQLRRVAVHSRDHGMCLRCGAQLSVEECHIHHTVKSKHGGTNALANLATLCRDCHCMMPGHEHMRVRTTYVIYADVIHRKNCKRLPQKETTVLKSVWNQRRGRWGKRKRRVRVMRPNLKGLPDHPFNICVEKGWKNLCAECVPDKQYYSILDRWMPTVLRQAGKDARASQRLSWTTT